MHPGPMNRGVEIDSEVADDLDRSVIHEQVEMGVAVRMACLEALIGGHRNARSGPWHERQHLHSSAARRTPARPPTSTPRIVDPACRRGDSSGAVLISDGKIADFGPNLFASGAPYGIESIDCRGLYLAPGIVDTRVHTGEPGEEHKETLESASAAAAVGGITSLVLLPDNEPPFDDASLIEFVARRARRIKLVNMYAYGALTVGLEGKELAEIGLLAEAGAVAFTDADHAVGNAQVMRRALYYAKAFDALIVHLPQEPSPVRWAHDQRRDGDAARPRRQSAARRGDAGRARHPPRRDDRRAAAPRQDLDGTKRWQRDRRRQGARAQDHLRYRRALLRAERSRRRRLPHLRQAGAATARREGPASPSSKGLKDGMIDAIVSDHRRRTRTAKRVPFAQAEPGGVGLETLLPISLELVHNGHLTLPRLFQLLSSTPASLFGLPGGKLAKGAPADLVVFDADYAWKVDRDELWSKTKNTPFDERPGAGPRHGAPSSAAAPSIGTTVSDGRRGAA